MFVLFRGGYNKKRNRTDLPHFLKFFYECLQSHTLFIFECLVCHVDNRSPLQPDKRLLE